MSALVVLAVVLWVLPTPSRKAVELTAGACGYLRGGARQAVLVTLVALHLRGAVAPARRGGLKAVDQLVGSTDPYERAVYGTLHDPIGLRAIRARKRVIEVGSETARRLVRAGLLLPTGRWLLVRLATGAVVVLGLFGLIAEPPRHRAWPRSRRWCSPGSHAGVPDPGRSDGDSYGDSSIEGGGYSTGGQL